MSRLKMLVPTLLDIIVPIIVYFLRPENRDGFHWVKTLVAPIWLREPLINEIDRTIEAVGEFFSGN